MFPHIPVFGQEQMDFPFTSPYGPMFIRPPHPGNNEDEESKSPSNLLNYDVVSVIAEYLTFTELLCLKYTNSSFYEIVTRIQNTAFFWRRINLRLFRELTCCRHLMKTEECVIYGLRRVNLSSVEFIEFCDSVEVTTDLLKDLRERCPKLRRVKLYINRTMVGNVEETEDVLKGVYAEFSNECLRIFRASRKNINEMIRTHMDKILSLKIDTNISRCDKSSKSPVHYLDTNDDVHPHGCYSLSGLVCCSCERKNLCVRDFPYFQRCIYCSKRCCRKCFVKPMCNFYYCSMCRIYFCKGCRASYCKSCSKPICPKCDPMECFICEEKVCQKCSSSFKHIPSFFGRIVSDLRVRHDSIVSIILCKRCCRKKRGKFVVSDDSVMKRFLDEDGSSYYGQGHTAGNQYQQLPPPPGGVRPATPPSPNLSVEDLGKMVGKGDRKQCIGEQLFPIVRERCDTIDEAGKITGMLLEMKDSELVRLVMENREELYEKIEEAKELLNESYTQ